MTDSSQQEFFLEHFQKVRDLLEGGEVKKALGVMLDVRENGFVNKELDTMIDSLRDHPPEAVVAEALRWSAVIIDRLKSFGGDVFQLVEEFSEASLGLSEVEWVPVDAGSQEDALSSESEGLLSMDFDGIDDMEFDLDLEDVGAEELDMDLDFADDDEQWDDLDDLDDFNDLENLDEISDLGELSDLDELSDVDASGPAQEMFESDDELALSDENVPPSVDFALVEGSTPLETSEDEAASDADDDVPQEIIREARETKPNASVVGEDRETKPHKAVSRDDESDETSLRETTRQTSAEQQAAADEVENLFEGFSFDDSEPLEDEASAPGEEEHGFVDEATRRSDPLKDLLATKAPASRNDTPSPEPEPESTVEAEEVDEDDFDFDLGFENPESRIETPAITSAISEPPAEEVDEPAEPAASSDLEDEDDDFDFDLGFDNPNGRTQTPTGTPFSAAASNRGGEEEDEDDFDFDLGFENPESKNSTPGRLGAGSIGGPSDIEHDLDFDKGPAQSDGGSASEQSSGSGARRDPEATPASMPSIPRFRPPSDEETSPRDDKDSASGDDSLDDDEFFELAESLTGESSEDTSQQGPYRGEPLMNASDTPMPTATPTPVPAPEFELSEVSQGRERADTPNPFAHEAPTGVQKALVDSNSSFVLEEIRDSEVSEAQDSEAAVGALMNEARRLYEKGKFESAHDLLEAVLERGDVNDDAQDLMGTVEGELERQHQAQLGALSKVPELKVKMSDIPTMNLDHRFGYLLSQIDGMSSFEDILELSSMTRLETLEVLAQMLERDIIGLN